MNTANCGSWRCGDAFGVRFGGMTWTDDELLAQEPPGGVDLVDDRVGHRHEAGERLGGTVGLRWTLWRISGSPIAPLVERRLDLPVAGVVAAHEANDDEALAMADLGLEDLEALGRRGRQRLLAHHGLAGLDAGQGERRVGLADRGDEHGVDVVGSR